MKYFVVQDLSDTSKLAIVGANGFTPDNVICEAPKSIDGSYVIDSSIVSIRTIQDSNGDNIVESFIDSLKLSAKAANDLIAEKEEIISLKYLEMNQDVLVQMYNTFGTTNPDSANAYKQTWELMKTKPALFRDEGLLVERQILAADGMTILFQLNDQLNDDLSVVGYATRLIQMAEEYGVFRMKRIQQFRNEKALILSQ
jgi:hypothetical protein